MAQFTRDINVKLDDGETERFVVQTFRNDAVKVELSATGQPYDVDIQTSDEHPQNDAGFNEGDYTSSLPLDPETYTDTNNHVTAAEAIDVSTFVSITNNAGQSEDFTGTIETHSQSAPSTAQEFATRGSGNRASAYRDGRDVNKDRYTVDSWGDTLQSTINTAHGLGGGVVDVEPDTYNPSSLITVEPGVVLDLTGVELVPDADVDLLQPKAEGGVLLADEPGTYGRIINGFVDTRGQGFTSTVCYISAKDDGGTGWKTYRFGEPVVDGLTAWGDTGQGTGTFLELFGDDSQEKVWFKQFLNLNCHGFEHGIYLNANKPDDSQATVSFNGNRFSGGLDDAYYLVRSEYNHPNGNSISGNQFYMQNQPGENTNTAYRLEMKKALMMVHTFDPSGVEYRFLPNAKGNTVIESSRPVIEGGREHIDNQGSISNVVVGEMALLPGEGTTHIQGPNQMRPFTFTWDHISLDGVDVSGGGTVSVSGSTTNLSTSSDTEVAQASLGVNSLSDSAIQFANAVRIQGKLQFPEGTDVEAYATVGNVADGNEGFGVKLFDDSGTPTLACVAHDGNSETVANAATNPGTGALSFEFDFIPGERITGQAGGTVISEITSGLPTRRRVHFFNWYNQNQSGGANTRRMRVGDWNILQMPY